MGGGYCGGGGPLCGGGGPLHCLVGSPEVECRAPVGFSSSGTGSWLICWVGAEAGSGPVGVPLSPWDTFLVAASLLSSICFLLWDQITSLIKTKRDQSHCVTPGRVLSCPFTLWLVAARQQEHTE